MSTEAILVETQMLPFHSNLVTAISDVYLQQINALNHRLREVLKPLAEKMLFEVFGSSNSVDGRIID